MATPTPGARLRALMDAGCVPIPGAFCALASLAIRDAGFDACYVSGGATSVVAGVPDIGLLSLDHFTRLIREIARASGMPVLADADTGFGEEEMVRRTVIEYAHAGAAGLHLEDQVFPKRCGHLDGKALVPHEHAIERVRWAATAARDSRDPHLIVCARTDAPGVEGLDAAIERSRAYLEVGADMIFPEGLRSEQEFRDFAAAIGTQRRADGGRVYLLANMTEFGKTPMLPLSAFAEMGYSCVIYPVTMLRIAMGAVKRGLETLRANGTVEPLLGEMLTRQELYGLIDYDPKQPWEFPGAG
ncbi:MAG: isocitrate lyase/phosphoenolpyruvate mutase family protein [Phycisphaeraceae bacterium]|nr:isocitrate lyase/phosphoenolpyruvate mutase family protein [Phycisphaeraceae bacterium]